MRFDLDRRPIGLLKSFEEHLQNLSKVCEKLRKLNIKFNPSAHHLVLFRRYHRMEYRSILPTSRDL